MPKPVITLTVTGDDLIRMKNENIINNLKREINQVIIEVAEKIIGLAKQSCPVRYGFLRASLGHFTPESISEDDPERTAEAQAGAIYEKEELDIRLGSGLPYARRQEFTHKTKKGFLRKAREQMREPFKKEIERIWNELVSG